MSLDPTDGGYSSRKFILTIVSFIVIVGIGVLSAFMPAVPTGDIIMGILGALGIFCGVNVWSKMAIGKNIVAKAEVDTKESSGEGAGC